MEKLLILTEEEIEIIKTGIFVGQHECQLPETEDSEIIRNLLEKLDAESETFIDGAMDSPLMRESEE